MLVSFSVSNFRSFHDEATLTMVASSRITDHPSHLVEIPGQDKKLVRGCVIYGANAAGKSNLIEAMAIAQELICVQSDTIPPVQSFRFCKDPSKDPSSFEFRFLVGEHVFTYGFDVRVDVFEAEWLSVLEGEDEITLFSRDESGKVTIPSDSFPKKLDDRFFGILQTLSSLPVKNRQLFLNRAISFPEEAIGTTLSSILASNCPTPWHHGNSVSHPITHVQTTSARKLDTMNM
jgi:hypothetical protein